jgi:aminoglycoside/choline kinase family phosphotransferase
MTTGIKSDLTQRIAELAAAHMGVSSDQVTVDRLAGDASTRSYFRVRSESSSLVVALYAEVFDENEMARDRLARLESNDPAIRLTFANDPCAHIEVTTIFANAGLPVPEILSVRGNDRSLLIRDVGDERLQDWLAHHDGTDSVEAYRQAVRMIVSIQAATADAIDSKSICSCLAFDKMKLRWELGFFFANYFNRYLGMKIDAETNQGIQREFNSLCSELSDRPRVLVHRDYHARNLMMLDGQLFIIDHQDARLGPASYDLASLLNDPYTSLDSDVIHQLIEDFIELKSSSTVPLGDLEQFRREFELMTLQRMLKAIGTYASQAVANNSSYLSYIKPAGERALSSIERLQDFHFIGSQLELALSTRASSA